MKTQKYFIPHLFLIFFTLNLFGQYNLSGKLIDSTGPVGFANVLLLRSVDSSLVKGAIALEDGSFLMEQVASGTYLLSVSLINYKTTSQSIVLVNDLELPDILLERTATNLDEVVVTTRKALVEQKIDRMVVNVQDNLTMAGGTALEVLEKSPGVVVDRSRNQISLIGKEGVLIMINGKISRQPVSAVIQMLNGINAENIDKIELITTPPAKYEAGSNGGIINIQILKRTDFGTNGSVSLSFGYGKKDKQGISLNLNHRNKNMNWYGDFSFNRNHSYERYTNNRSVELLDELFTYKTISERDPIATNFNGQIGLDYSVNPNLVLGTFVSGFINDWDMNASNQGVEERATSSSTFKINTTEKNQWSHMMANFNLEQKMKNASLNFDLDYLYYQNENPTGYQNIFFNEAGQFTKEEFIRASKETPVDIWVSRLDYSININKNIQVELGTKGTFSNLKNNIQLERLENDIYITDDQLSENASLSEEILAVYSSINWALSSKTQINAGLRYEYSSTNLDTRTQSNLVDLNYGKLFPTIYWSQELNKDWSTNLSYGRRITRPTYNDLAPFVIFFDPNTYFFGNSALLPSFTDNVKLDFKYKTYTLSFQYNHERDAIAPYQPTLLEGTTQQVFTSLNLDYRDTYTALLSVPFKLTKWWNIRINTLGAIRKIATKQDENLSEEYIRINGNSSFTLPEGFAIDVSGFYQTESIWGIAKLSPFGNLSLGIQKKISDTSKLRFTFDNIFGFDYDVFTAQGLRQPYATSTNYLYEPRIFKLTYSNLIGNNKLKSSRTRRTGSEEMKGRVN